MSQTPNFPDDENGEVLRSLHESGEDLSVPRDIEFIVVLPDQDAVDSFGSHFLEKDYNVTARKTDTAEGLPWDVLIIRNMIPTHEAITAFEAELEAVAAPLGGRNDGWECYEL